MNKQTYIQLMSFWEERPRLKSAVVTANTALTALVFLCYPALLLWLGFRQPDSLPCAILVPGISFALVSALRYALNRKRPYEEYGIASALGKTSAGKSFPSRHVFSVFVIAVTWLCLFPLRAVGTVLLVVGALLAIVRVLGGVHFPGDVIAGAVIGIAAGLLGFYLFL